MTTDDLAPGAALDSVPAPTPFDGSAAGPQACPDGNEPFWSSGERLDLTLRDFWRWVDSDLLGASTRSRLAEFIVAKLLGICIVEARAGGDLVTPEGIAVRVKSASAVGREGGRDLARVHFAPLPWRASRRDPGGAASLPRERAHVFALVGHANEGNVNPLDLDQWRFFVPPIARIEAKMKKQRSLSLAALDVLSGGPVAAAGLQAAVRRAARPSG